MTQAHNIGAMTRRLLRWHDAATAAQVHDGLTWYDDARRFAGTLADATGYSIGQVAALIAALSPNVDWPANMRAAQVACDLHADGHRPETLPGYGGYRANVAKAWRILDGDVGALRGPKVEAFAAAIEGDMSHVVLDVWATRAARDRQRQLAYLYRDDEMPGRREARAMIEAYRRAAALRGIDPAAMQAIVWVTIRDGRDWQRTQDLSPAARRRFYQRQARAREAIGAAVMPTYWKDAGKRAQVAAAIGAA